MLIERSMKGPRERRISPSGGVVKSLEQKNVGRGIEILQEFARRFAIERGRTV
jgi:hypothetical protein